MKRWRGEVTDVWEEVGNLEEDACIGKEQYDACALLMKTFFVLLRLGTCD